METLHKSIIENTEIIQLLSGNMDAMNTNFEAKLNVHGQRLGTMWQTLNLTHLEITAVRRNLKSLRQEIRNATDDILGALSNHEKRSAYQQMRLSVEYRTTVASRLSGFLGNMNLLPENRKYRIMQRIRNGPLL